jgi:hypothetical protein
MLHIGVRRSENVRRGRFRTFFPVAWGALGATPLSDGPSPPVPFFIWRNASHCASFDARIVSAKRIDRPVDKRRASHPLSLVRFVPSGCEEGAPTITRPYDLRRGSNAAEWWNGFNPPS